MAKVILNLVLLGLMTDSVMAQEPTVTSLMTKGLTDDPGKEVLMIAVEYAPEARTLSTDTMPKRSSTCWRAPWSCR